LHNTAQDGEFPHPVASGKQYIFDSASGDSSSSLLASIFNFLDQNMGGSCFIADNPNRQAPVLNLGTIGSHSEKIWHHPQSGINIGSQLFYSISGTWHGISSLTRMLRTRDMGLANPYYCSCQSVSFSLTSGLSTSLLTPQSSRLVPPLVTTVQVSDSNKEFESLLRCLSHSTQWCNPIGSEMTINP